MSAKQFIEIFKSSDSRKDLYNQWKSKNNSWLNYTRKELEDKGLSKTIGLAITKDKAKALGIEEVFDKLVSDIEKNSPNRGPFIDYTNGTPVVIFPGIKYDGGVERTIKKYFGEEALDKYYKSDLVKGHVFGVQTGAIIGVKESLLKSKAVRDISVEEINSATKFIDILVEHLIQLDLESSTLKNFTSPILAKYYKSSRHFLVELQTEKENSESAKLVQKLAGRTSAATTGLRGIMTPGGSQTKALNSVLSVLRSQGLSNENILKLETSPSLKSMIKDDIISSLTNKPKKLKDSYSESNLKVGETVSLYVNEQAKEEYRKNLNRLKSEAQKAKAALLKAKSQIRKHSGQFISLVNIQSLINSALHNQIRKNMGNGNARNILNYRTGRFAESAKVERMSQSREGMITAFYSYMKYPYQTFEPGFKQGHIASRDPKLLLSKSIREIAATLVKNKMRAVRI